MATTMEADDDDGGGRRRWRRTTTMAADDDDGDGATRAKSTMMETARVADFFLNVCKKRTTKRSCKGTVLGACWGTKELGWNRGSRV
jgi:hypothetical protein